MRGVQLITYPDSLGGSLATLRSLLQGALRGYFTEGVHILPPYPSSGDRGFAPITYATIDKAYGSWADIEEIGKTHRVIVDLMANHLSRLSEQFQNYLCLGKASPYANMFIQSEKIWPHGPIPQSDLDKIFLRRSSPFSTYQRTEGKPITVWTTFGSTDPSEQIDLDIHAKETRQFLTDLLHHFHSHTVSSLRLDAVAYVTKKAGTDCFFVEPDIFDFLTWLQEKADENNLTLLPEIHAPLAIQDRLSENGYWSYDFASPFLILDALINHNAEHLIQYHHKRPLNMFTMLDCHDGIPVYPDIRTLLPEENILRTAEHTKKFGANFSPLLSTKKDNTEESISIHQINATYLSALGNDNKAYLAARAIQLFLPGIPQVYYVGLLAGENAPACIEQQKDKRAINRKNYSVQEIQEALTKNIVQQQLAFIELRNTHPAFEGTHSITDSEENLVIEWIQDAHVCRLSVNMLTYEVHIYKTA